MNRTLRTLGLVGLLALAGNGCEADMKKAAEDVSRYHRIEEAASYQSKIATNNSYSFELDGKKVDVSVSFEPDTEIRLSKISYTTGGTTVNYYHNGNVEVLNSGYSIHDDQVMKDAVLFSEKVLDSYVKNGRNVISNRTYEASLEQRNATEKAKKDLIFEMQLEDVKK